MCCRRLIHPNGMQRGNLFYSIPRLIILFLGASLVPNSYSLCSLKTEDCPLSIRSSPSVLKPDSPPSCARRVALGTINSILNLLLASESTMAQAAAPITQAEVENVGARAARFFRPKPPKVLRPRLDRDFAVLLMRSSYNILDQLDCVPMDQFQRDFFILRQGTVERNDTQPCVHDRAVAN